MIRRPGCPTVAAAATPTPDGRSRRSGRRGREYVPRACLVLGLLAIVLAGCGGDDGFSPGPPARVEGQWSYRATLQLPGGGECVLSGATIRIDQDGDGFRGSVSEYSVRCGDDLCRVSGTTFRGGSVRGELVEFSFLGLRHAGQVTVDIMRGRVTAGQTVLDCLDQEGRTVDLEGASGDWMARL